MVKLLIWTARGAGVLGFLLSVAAIAARASGAYHLGNFQAGTILQGGMAFMIIGCLAYLAALVERTPR